MLRLIFFICVMLTTFFWIEDSNTMLNNLQKTTVINGDTLKIVDKHTFPYPLSQTYTLSDGTKIEKILCESNLVK
jgi:hypothetical protein